MILRMLENPADAVCRTARNRKLELRFRNGVNFGCSLTLAGYGIRSPRCAGHTAPGHPAPLDCDVWWNEVARGADNRLMSTGQRIGTSSPWHQRPGRHRRAYVNIRRIRVVGSYYRTDIGKRFGRPENDGL